ncbi:hypothetical protein AB6896_15620 [Rahnella inusitata]|uniref:hypothetical protein n=1 Tax=Rahnella inusitata TaxID=58169 RepID=UPI0039BE03AB
MPQGIQCWDAAGNLVADIGDYNCRLLGTVNITSPVAANPIITTSFSGMTAAGSFAVIVATSNAAYPSNLYACRAVDGGFNTYLLTTTLSVAVTLTVYLYGFL